jgi:diguanylate cyclase (GGDEF)-like protein
MPDDVAQGRRILIADDHDDNIELLRARLESRGYTCESARDGEEALQRIAQSPPDLLLLDLMMPKVDGFEVARRVKSDPKLPFIPIIIQTALDTTEQKVEGLSAGADDYITKPINFLELEARVRSMLRIKALQDALSAANEELSRLATTDGLTGLLNRGNLEFRLREMFDFSQRLHEPLSCVLFDLDHFKQVNDNHGHQAGDDVLRQFAALLLEAAREIDKVGRYGGEEFMVILPGTVLDAAVTFAERARQTVEQHLFRTGEITLRRTVSCGVAGWPHPEIDNREHLVKAADDALYLAKALGRNRVVRFGSAEFHAQHEADHDHAQDGNRSEGSRGAGGRDGDAAPASG